ncbi:SCO3242 family prenyltransferase [Streptomyces sp. NBC_01198]|uniref:SCO3242 family prenyltransferase n=1 Tax=Streptomyces sp. NBC_01198 TaxID=2903769 RepID=UPI002E1656E5|nr:UbiA family prenyltransferase [Streptomyces sp. NBC_01198]
MSALRDLAELVRAPAALSVPGDAVAGAASCGVLGPATAGLSASAVCLYWAGMAANDWADRDLDAKERPERPIPSGRVSPTTALGVAAGLCAAGLALAGLAGGPRALAVAVPLAGAVWAYDLRFKGTPAGPAAMAACRGLDVLLGATSRPGRWWPAVLPALTVAAHTYGVTALSRREVTGGGRLLPAATLAGTAGVAYAAARIPAAGPATAPRTWLPRGLAGWYAAAYGAPQAGALATPDAGRTRAAVGAGITGLPALQGALVARSAGLLPAAAVAACAPLGRALARRVSPT